MEKLITFIELKIKLELENMVKFEKGIAWKLIKS